VPRRTFPRSEDHHRLVAREILERHAVKSGTPVTLPVPIELIIEMTYELQVLWQELMEPPETVILGALFPAERRIVLNERHADTFDRWIGPERFTLAHELAHWVYDADDPNQLSFDLTSTRSEQYCYHRKAPGLADGLRIREVNANKLAAHLLLPEHLVREVPVDSVSANFRQQAAEWGVSQQTLQIRLGTMGLIDPETAGRLSEL
jgi:hypothetical protein